MRFEFFPALLILPVALFVAYLTKRKKTTQNRGAIFTGPFTHTPASTTGGFFTVFLPWAGITCLIIALARPQTGFERLPDAAEGVDIVLTLDVSTSMLAEDYDPNRLEVAKDAALKFIDDRPNDRIGLVLYAAEPVTICPPTFDHATLERFIRNAELGFLTDGTAIGAGLATAARGLGASSTDRRVIVLLSDGVETAGVVDPVTVAQAVNTLHGDSIAVYTVAIGRENSGYDVDRETLSQIAELNNGRLFNVYNRDDLEEVYEEIDELEASLLPESGLYVYRDHYLGWLIAGLLLLAVGEYSRWKAFRVTGGGC
ncbi:aerotolerance regulator BatA [Candidatus Fermentibacteria bacterium]|nr:MAG: aerotolerance regulator BatA [Candidatus Fermentibacteria bacterium]